MSRLFSMFTYIGALGVIALAAFVLSASPEVPNSDNVQTTQPAQVASTQTPSPPEPPPAPPPPPALPPTPKTEVSPPSPQINKTEGTSALIARVENPYPFPPDPFSVINERARAALVNILCVPRGGSLRPTSASGVIIDPRGVILTNAHVAQYVLLAQSGRVALSCSVRAEAPARPVGTLEVLFIPPAWVEKHAKDISNPSPTGTGEHDYALLRIVTSPEARFPWLPIDTREAIGFTGDLVLAASYPSEFIGGLATLNDLYAVSSISPIGELLTFEERSPDLFSLGGVIEAQSGSSGGPVVNAWGRLIGIITTTSDGATTAERELRALTLSYINRDLLAEAGQDLRSFLALEPRDQAVLFQETHSANLTQLLIDGLKSAR